MGGLRLIVFDFDQTLSVFHVFKSLAGWGERLTAKGAKDGLNIPKPFATSEEGQVRRIEELNQTQFREAGGFAMAAFGGNARVAEVRSHLHALQNQNIELMICTKGLVGAVKKCLVDLDLLSFFAEVYGNVSDNYGKLPYDQSLDTMEPVPGLRQLLGSSDCSNWHSKDKLINRLRAQKSLAKDEVVLVEDDPEEIYKAIDACLTVFVKEARGMTSAHFAELQRLHTGESEAVAKRKSKFKMPKLPCVIM